MKGKKTIILLASIALIAIMVSPVFADLPPEYHSNLYATDKLIDVGEVIVARFTNTLYVTFVVDEGCYLKETHLEVVDNPEDFPMTKTGNPKVGKFTYAAKNLDPETTEVTFAVDVSGTPVTQMYYIAAHAVVICPCIGEQTAWGDTDGVNMHPFPGNNWAFYFIFTPD